MKPEPELVYEPGHRQCKGREQTDCTKPACTWTIDDICMESSYMTKERHKRASDNWKKATEILAIVTEQLEAVQYAADQAEEYAVEAREALNDEVAGYRMFEEWDEEDESEDESEEDESEDESEEDDESEDETKMNKLSPEDKMKLDSIFKSSAKAAEDHAKKLRIKKILARLHNNE